MKIPFLSSSVIILFALSVNSIFAKECFGHFSLGGVDYTAPFYQPAISLDTFIDPGTAINLPVSITLFGQGTCTCTADSAWWIYNGNLISTSPNYTITDTGVYTINQSAFGNMGCDDNNYSFSLTLHVAYRTTNTVSELTNLKLVQIFPSISTGLFKIKNDPTFHITKILILDDTARLIYCSTTMPAEINLSNFPAGVYTYEATDESGRLARGRLIKN